MSFNRRAMTMANDDDLDLELEQFLEQPIDLDAEPILESDPDLDALVQASQELKVDQTDLEDLLTPPEPSSWAKPDELTKFSYLNKVSSSLVRARHNPVRFRDLARQLPKGNGRLLMQALVSAVEADVELVNPLERLSPKSMLALAARLNGSADFLEGGEAVLIIRPRSTEERMKPMDILELHLHSMPVDSIAFYRTNAPTLRLTQELARRGLKLGIDYEFVEPTALMQHERSALQVFSSRGQANLRLIRKLRVTKSKAKRHS